VLSRIARDLYQTARDVERAQNVVRVLEVHHKMYLARQVGGTTASWAPVCEAFGVEADAPGEEVIYDALVLSSSHPYSVRGRIASARERSRTLRECISEEMWEHLNRFHLEIAPLGFAGIRQLGRSEFNRRIELFCDAFHGLADDTMIHGAEWHFLRLGKFVERAAMLCKILEVKRKNLELAPGQAGRPIDFHQWQSLLRSVSGYEPYRRVYDARIVPARVLDLVLTHPDFPRSFLHCLERIEESLCHVAADAHAQHGLVAEVRRSIAEVAREPGASLLDGGLEHHVQVLRARCESIAAGVEGVFFRSRLPALGASVGTPGAPLHGQVQQ